jgi:hypothetical protein
MKVLMVLTSHDRLGDSGRETGFWLEELAAPYYPQDAVGGVRPGKHGSHHADVSPTAGSTPARCRP